jgi:hypothetical protein
MRSVPLSIRTLSTLLATRAGVALLGIVLLRLRVHFCYVCVCVCVCVCVYVCVCVCVCCSPKTMIISIVYESKVHFCVLVPLYERDGESHNVPKSYGLLGSY